MKTIQTSVPEKLFKGASRLVEEGWFKDENEVFSEAIRRFLETHQSELMTSFIREDIEWGIHGEE